MKKYLLFCVLVLIFSQGFAQLTIAPGAHWINSGNVSVNVADVDFLNDGNFVWGTSVMKFTGSSDKNIGGDSLTTFYDLEIAKTGNTKVSLQSNAGLIHMLNFTSGFFDLNQRVLEMSGTAFLNNENENSRMTGLNGGEAIMIPYLNNPNNVNPGNLGIVITSSANLGSVTIRRGHKTQTGTGLSSSINRYFNIIPDNNTNLNATIRFTYFDAELNSQNESTMIMFKSDDNGSNWTNQSVNSRDVNANYVEKNGLENFSLLTLAGAVGTPLPVTGLEFFARRMNSSQVKLDWKTIQEVDNSGFYVERKRETDNDFATTGFVNSHGINGNSNFPLEYTRIDTNNFAGNTYYRLKQVDIDGKYIYSVIRMVSGETQKQVVLKAWPIPAAGDFNIMVQGIDKNDAVLLYDASGKLIKTISVTDGIPQKVKKLAAGAYIIQLSGEKNMSQRIIVQ